MTNETPLTPLDAIMDDEDALAADSTAQRLSDYREAAEKATDFFRRLVMSVMAFKGNKAFALDCACLALNWTDIIGCDSQVKLADRWKCKKENVRKLMAHIQKLTGAPPTPNQRSEDGRKKMSNKRRGQLK